MNGGILTGAAISSEVAAGRIAISDFDPSRVNPASYDLTLGPKVAVYKSAVRFRGFIDSYRTPPVDGHPDVSMAPTEYPYYTLDSRKPNAVHEFVMKDTGWRLLPGIGYLMHTAERVRTEHFVPIIDGKSSLGRLFITAHITAGYGDPGFDGQYTLEVVVTNPVIVYPGMRFCQIRFHTLVGEVTSYKHKGHYVGVDHTNGPVPSMSWKQFEEEKARTDGTD